MNSIRGDPYEISALIQAHDQIEAFLLLLLNLEKNGFKHISSFLRLEQFIIDIFYHYNSSSKKDKNFVSKVLHLVINEGLIFNYTTDMSTDSKCSCKIFEYKFRCKPYRNWNNLNNLNNKINSETNQYFESLFIQ
jgi:hypothetical protein